MESLDEFAERFRADVEKESGRVVYKKAVKHKYNLHRQEHYPTGVFAYISKRVTPDRFNVAAWEWEAKKVGVANSADKRAPKFIPNGDKGKRDKKDSHENIKTFARCYGYL